MIVVVDDSGGGGGVHGGCGVNLGEDTQLVSFILLHLQRRNLIYSTYQMTKATSDGYNV